MIYRLVDRSLCLMMMIVGLLLAHACGDMHTPAPSYAADTLRIRELNTSAMAKLYADPDSMLILSSAALALSDSLSYERGRFQSLFNIGLAYRALGKYQQSVDQLALAQEVARTWRDTLLQTRVLSVSAQVYVDLGDHENALERATHGLLLAQQARLRSQEAYLLSIVGMIYGLREKDHDKALDYYGKSLSIYQDLGDSTMMPFVLDNMAHVYLYKGDIGLAEENYTKAYHLAQDLKQPKAILTALQSLSHFYTRTDQLDKALGHLLQARDMLQHMPGDRTQYLFMLYQLTDLYQSKGDADLALSYGREAMEIAEREQRLWHMIRIAGKLAEVYEIKKDYRNAYLLSEKARISQDSLYKKDKEDNIVRIEERYKYQKEQDQVKAEHQLQLQRKQSYLYMFILISIALLLILLVVMWFLRQRNVLNSKLHEANECIEKQNDKLMEEAQFKTHLISLITHDVRAPISNLNMIINVLNHGNSSGNWTEKSLKGCRQELDKVKYFMEDFLRWAVFQSEGARIHKSYFDLGDVIRSVVSLYDPQAHEKDITITEFVDEDVEVYGIKEAIATVVRNLVGNAIKFTEAGGTVVVKAAKQYDATEPTIIISVEDSGIGMSEDVQHSLFAPASQTDRSGRRGLGLFLCNYFLSLHDSTLHVSSRLGIGTVFSFSLIQPSDESIAQEDRYADEEN